MAKVAIHKNQVDIRPLDRPMKPITEIRDWCSDLFGEIGVKWDFAYRGDYTWRFYFHNDQDSLLFTLKWAR